MHADETEYPLPQGGSFMGHPRLLWMLVWVTIGFNFAFYGFRAFLAPYAADTFFANLSHDEALKQANFLFAGFGSITYATAILGGWVADNVLGEVQSLRLSLWLAILGLVGMVVPNREIFTLSLAFFVLAAGLGIPLTVLIGRNYAKNDPKREAGYTLFYMAINFGAFVAPFVCASWIGATYGYRWGFMAAAVGALWAAAIFEWKHRRLPGAGEQVKYRRRWSTPVVVLVTLALVWPCALLLAHPRAMDAFVYALMIALIVYFVVSCRRRGDRVQTQRYIALAILFVAMVLFWALSLLSGSALNFFARDFVTPIWPAFQLFGMHVPAAGYIVFQSINPLYILIFAPFLAVLWPWLDRRGWNPSTPRKFGIGLLLVALGYGAVLFAIEYLRLPDGKVAAWTLLLCYLGSTIGELALSPIGYGVIGKLAAHDEASIAMGGWFFGVSVSYNLAGQIAAFTTTGGIEAYARVFEWLLIGGIAIALVYLIAAPWIVKLMHGVK